VRGREDLVFMGVAPGSGMGEQSLRARVGRGGYLSGPQITPESVAVSSSYTASQKSKRVRNDRLEEWVTGIGYLELVASWK